MKRTYVFCVLLSYLLSAAAMGVQVTEITYETTDVGSGRWEYTYEVSNIDLWVNQQQVAIREFTIWFDDGLYDNLSVTTPTPLSTSWDEIHWQPEPLMQDPGAYDALILPPSTGIGIGESLYGFSVDFDWLGTGSPGSQYYEIINPDTFETIDTGYTIPEPATVVLLGFGAVVFRQRKKILDRPLGRKQ